MFSMKNAALVGLATADRTLFAPVASQYGQVASPYGQAVAYDPAVAGAYAMSADAYAQPMEYVQPVEFVQPEQGSDSQTWVLGLGALALVGAAAARATQASSSVAALDEVDIETAQRVATLGVGGAGKSQADAGGILGFLMSGRRGVDGKTDGSLELLSGLTRPAVDNPQELNRRFKVTYDTRDRKQGGPRKAVKSSGKGPTTWRSKNKDTSLYN